MFIISGPREEVTRSRLIMLAAYSQRITVTAIRIRHSSNEEIICVHLQIKLRIHMQAAKAHFDKYIYESNFGLYVYQPKFMYSNFKSQKP